MNPTRKTRWTGLGHGKRQGREFRLNPTPRLLSMKMKTKMMTAFEPPYRYAIPLP